MLAWLQRWILRACNGLCADTAARAGGSLGVLAWRLGVRRRVANDVIARTLGLSGPARSRITRRAYATMGANFVELWTIGGPDGPERHVGRANPRWQAAIHRRFPALAYVGPHIGSWDMGACGIVGNARRFLVYAKAQHNPVVDRLINAQRQRVGCEVLFADHGDRAGAVTAFRAMRAGASLGLIADQRPSEHESVPALFLGQPAQCHQGPRFFAERARIALVPAFCLRRRAGESLLFVGRPLPSGGELDRTQLAMDWCAAMIAAFPGQYFWQHRRFAGRIPQVAPRASEPWRERGLDLLGIRAAEAAATYGG
jgi:Kdo2-lipid IVA lauroyltransferase/acyltransferase